MLCNNFQVDGPEARVFKACSVPSKVKKIEIGTNLTAVIQEQSEPEHQFNHNPPKTPNQDLTMKLSIFQSAVLAMFIGVGIASPVAEAEFQLDKR